MRPSLRSLRPLVAAAACAATVLAGCASGDATRTEDGGGSTSGSVDEPATEQRRADGVSPHERVAPDRGDVEEELEREPVTWAHASAPDPAGPYELSPAEMLPEAKSLAAGFVQALITYEAEEPASEIAARASEGRRSALLLAAAAPVLHLDAWSRGEIVYPQLGGFTDEAASVMVVAKQTVGLPDGEVFEESRTFDVRLAIEDGVWVFDRLASAGGRPVERPGELSDEAAAVLDDERIELPDTARWDIHREAVQPTLLELMALMAERSEYGVVVLDTGHPWEVFGTDRQSRHSVGRAVDVYRLDGPHVIDDRQDGSRTQEFVRWLYEQPEMTNMGAPWALDERGGRSFTDDLHQDHLHVEAAATPTE